MARRHPAYSVFRFAALALFLICAMLPLYWILLTSLKGSKGIYDLPLKYFITNPTLESYRKLFSFMDFGLYFRNSFVLTICSSIAAMIVSFMSGFALSRYKSKKRQRAILIALYFTQTIPSFITMVPLYAMFSKFHILDNRIALGFVYTSSVVAFATIMCKGFLDRVPVSLEEAARIDGCTVAQSLVHVILPITLPGMAAIFCFSFVNIWNELFVAVMLLNSNDKMTIPVALNSFISKAGVSWDVMSAGIVVTLLPTVVVFGIGQKYIVSGLTAGSVKE